MFSRKHKYSTRHLLFICLLFLQEIDSFCPSKCVCNKNNNLRVACINAGLEVVPIQLNPDVNYINLTLNQILNVHFTLQFYTQLEILDLSRNKIDTLGSKNFESQNELQELFLSMNFIINLSKDAFRGLRSLVNLDLSYNQINSIHHSAMQDLSKLVKLNMASNNIISLDGGVFKNLIMLGNLDLKNNQLLDVPTENMLSMRNLHNLDLTGNFIEYIRNNSFDMLSKLRSLRMTGNIISELDQRAFDGLNELMLLHLDDNNITVVPTLQLSKLSKLSHLSLSGNNFNLLPPVAFLNLFHLKELHLDHLDRLVTIDSRAFVDNTLLEIITLDNNQLFFNIPPKLFHGNLNLIAISMRRNSIKTLDAAQLPLDRLKYLKLADNPLICNCSLLWLWRLTSDRYSNSDGSNTTNLLILDSDEIGCDTKTKTRRILKTMTTGEINCPVNIVTMVSAIISVLLVVMAGVSVLVYLKIIKKKKLAGRERKNVNERIIPQQVDKLELERYLADQNVANEYRPLRHWELPVKELIEEPDHYENFDDFHHRHRNVNKPHVVYV